MSVSLVCTCDESYLPLLKVFLNSLDKNGEIAYNLHVRLINVPDVPEFLHDANIIHDNTPLDSSRNKLINEGMPLHDFVSHKSVQKNKNSLYRGARWLYSDKMAYCANIKFNTINTLLETEQQLFYFDVDTVVRKSIAGLIDMLTNCDILIKMTPSNPDKPFSEPYKHLYHTGMIGISNNSRTKHFFKLLEHNVNESDFFNWDTDQIEFANLIERDKIDVSINDIPDIYKDEFYSIESNIWCGAAAGKVSNVEYINEMKKYEHV